MVHSHGADLLSAPGLHPPLTVCNSVTWPHGLASFRRKKLGRESSGRIYGAMRSKTQLSLAFLKQIRS